MSVSLPISKPPFKVVETSIAAIQHPVDLVSAVIRREIDGVIVRGLFPPARMARVDARLAEDRLEFRATPPQRGPEAWKFRHLLGMTLVTAGSDSSRYFDVAENFHGNCRRLFDDGPDFEAALFGALAACSGGRSILTPRGPDRRSYALATIRVLPPGSGIDLHCDNNLAHHPSYEHLRTLLQVDRQLSYFVPIAVPDAGGELVLYDREWRREDDDEGRYVYEKPASAVAGCARMVVAPGAGDLLIFRGGTIYHEVTAVAGRATRRTIGGFLAPSLDGTWIGVWS
jgi:hypothetical protein